MRVYKAFVGNQLVAWLNLNGDDEMTKRVATEIIARASQEALVKQRIGPEFYGRLAITIEVSNE